MTGGLGIVATALGIGFAASAAGTKSDADAFCSSAGCFAEGKSLLADAGSKADVATVAITLGAVFVATGTVLWLVSPSLRAEHAAVSDFRPIVRF